MKISENSVDSFALVERLISSHQNIAYFHVLDVTTPPLLQERVEPDFLDPSVIRRALELKEKYEMPFWDAYFMVSRESAASMQDVFRAALLHDGATSRLRRMRSQDASTLCLRQMEEAMRPGQMLALSSLVEL